MPVNRVEPSGLKPGLLAALIGLFVLLVAAAFGWGPHVLKSQLGVLNVVVLGVFALLAAAILAGVLGATGLIKTAKQQIGGAAAIFLAIFSASVAAVGQVSEHGLNLQVQVQGVKAGERALVQLAGNCRAEASGPVAIADLVLTESCDKDPLRFTISVDGYNPVEQVVRRKDAQESALIQLKWVGAKAAAISGTVYISEGKLASSGTVTLGGCPTGKVAYVNASNGGFSLEIPEDCDHSPPFTLTIRDTGEWETTAKALLGNKLVKPAPSLTPSADKPDAQLPVQKSCQVDAQFWAIVKCAGGCRAPTPPELKQLQARLQTCTQFCVCQ